MLRNDEVLRLRFESFNIIPGERMCLVVSAFNIHVN